MEQTTQNLPTIIPAEEQQAPAVYQPAALSYFSDVALFESGQRMAKLLAASDLVPQQFRGNIANTLIALEMAARTGSSPLAVMQSMYVVHGKPSWSATFIIASINASGRYSPLRFQMTGEGDDLTCRAYAVERETGERLESPPISIRTAKAEGWYGKSGSKWQTMPELMLRYRAATLFGRLYAADILMGMQTADELADIGETTPPPRRNNGRRHGDATATPPAPINNGPATVAEVNALLNATEAKPAPVAAPAAPPAPPADAKKPCPPAPPAEEEPPHPAETAEAKPDNHGLASDEQVRAMNKYIRALDEIRGMSQELPGWPERQTKMAEELGGKDDECYTAVIDYWNELMDELQAKMIGNGNGNGNGKK